MTLRERLLLQLHWDAGDSVEEIAVAVGQPAEKIRRELDRYSDGLIYDAYEANRAATKNYIWKDGCARVGTGER